MGMKDEALAIPRKEGKYVNIYGWAAAVKNGNREKMCKNAYKRTRKTGGWAKGVGGGSRGGLTGWKRRKMKKKVIRRRSD